MRKTKNPKKLLRTKCDKLWQEIGKRNNPKCFFCSKDAYCMHHFIRKSQCAKLRYSYKNAIPVCYFHHQRIHFPDPELIDQIILTKGREWLDELLAIKNLPPESSYQTMKYYKTIFNTLSKLK